jgi:flavin reductase (DIM6/NTAB) family NADH-FMN oxidoreductase RutF
MYLVNGIFNNTGGKQMRKNFGAKPWTYPQPVFIIATYGEDGTPDAMNAAWGGISDDTQISMCLSPEHKTVENILARGAFTVSMADAAHVAECDYVGIESANRVPDKVEKAGFHTEKAEFVDAPVIVELAMAVECKLVSYDKESCRLVGEIVNVSADEKILDENGKIDPAKLEPIVFDPVNHVYLKLGEKAGNAFKDGMKLK